MIQLGNVSIGNPPKMSTNFLTGISELVQGSITGSGTSVKDMLGNITSAAGAASNVVSETGIPDLSDIKTVVGGKVMNITEMFGIKDKPATLDPFEEEDIEDWSDDPDGIHLKDNLKLFAQEAAEQGTPKEENTKEDVEKKLLEGAKNLIEGLGLDAILDKLAELCKPLQQALKGIQASIESIKENKRISPEEKQRRLEALKKQRKDQLQQWKDSQKEFVQRTIDDIKSEFSNIKFQVENMVALVPIIIAQVNLPTFIGTGSPNPARTVADFLSYKHLLQNMAKPIENSCTRLLNLCKSIHFNLPDAALKTIESVSKITEVIDQIPG